MNVITPVAIAVTLALAFFIHPGFLIMPGVPVLAMIMTWVLGWRCMEDNRDQFDTVLDMFAYPTKWVSDGNAHVFNNFLALYQGTSVTYVTLGRGGPRLEANRYYAEKIHEKLTILSDWRQMRQLLDTMKDADHAQSLLEPTTVQTPSAT